MKLNRIAALLIAATALVSATGCGYSHGTRAGPGPDYARHVFSLYDEPDRAAGEGGRAPAIAVPLNVAVAELGEVGPAPALVERLQKEARLFRRVEGIPGIAGTDYASSPYGTGGSPGTPAGEAHAAMQRMIRLARDAGMDYLMLFGATVDSESHATGMSLVNLTIVGAYVIPSRHMTGRARASAVLVDLRTNRVVLIAGTEANESRFASAVGEEGSQDNQVKKLRDAVFASLGDRIAADLTRRAQAQGGASAPGTTAAPTGAPAARVPVVDPFAASAGPRVTNAAPSVTAESSAACGFVPLPPDAVPARQR